MEKRDEWEKMPRRFVVEATFGLEGSGAVETAHIELPFVAHYHPRGVNHIVEKFSQERGLRARCGYVMRVPRGQCTISSHARFCKRCRPGGSDG